MTPIQGVCNKIEDKKPFKVRNTEPNFKTVMEACQGKIKWCSGEMPLSIPYHECADSPYICIDYWWEVYSIAVPFGVYEQAQTEVTL